MRTQPSICLIVSVATVVCFNGIAVSGAGLPPSTQLVREDKAANEKLLGFTLTGADDGRGNAGVGAPEVGPVNLLIQAETIKPLAHPWEMQLRALNAAPVEKGDVLLASFWIRSKDRDARTVCVFEQADSPYEKSLAFSIDATAQWKKFDLPFTSLDRYPIGKASFNFEIGFGPQTIEIGGIELRDFGQHVNMSDLPRTRASYTGREPDAPWRREAAERIEKIRKADLVVTVKDAAGHPLAGALVNVKMIRHAFGFGSAVSSDHLLGKGADDETYRQQVVKLFNRAVMENDLKWPQWEADRHLGLDSVDWLNARGIAVRGHNLVWPNFRYLPADLSALRSRPEELRRRVDDHITDEASALKGRVIEWDVLNEPWSEHQLQDVLGKESMIEWFKLAHAADPGARLFINDYAMPDEPPQADTHLDEYESQIRYLIDGGAPLGGIGFQCHYDHDTFTPPERIAKGLDRFARFKKPIEVTEFDFDTDDEQLQADATRDLLTVAFSHPAVDGLLMWGFWEGSHWRPRGAMFRKDWSLKPNGQVWMDLVFKQWWTNATGQSDAKGRFTTRGFCGDYDITARSGDKSKTVKASLGREGTNVTLTLE